MCRECVTVRSFNTGELHSPKVMYTSRRLAYQSDVALHKPVTPWLHFNRECPQCEGAFRAGIRAGIHIVYGGGAALRGK